VNNRSPRFERAPGGEMGDWAVWVVLAVAVWAAAATLVALLRAGPRGQRRSAGPVPDGAAGARSAPSHDWRNEWNLEGGLESRRRILVVDDDPALRLLLQTTLAADEYMVEDASSAEEAAEIARFWRPTLVVLDVGLPGISGLAFCRELKSNDAYGSPTVILLTGADMTPDEVKASRADALLRKPFSPLELVSLVDRLPGGETVLGSEHVEKAGAEQLLVYARDLNRVLEVERVQRRLLQHAYRQTVAALTDALEAKDPRTRLHALRVQRYATELTGYVDRRLLDDASLEYGFLLHDIGKIGVPDAILNKRGTLDPTERSLMQQHPVIGADILSDIPLLDGQGLHVVRSHHERWDGTGYPEGLGGDEIPVGARIFAVADALDAMTNDRPYRERLTWEAAVDEILAEAGRQFDPRVVAAFAVREQRLRRIHEDLAPKVA
jgi:ribonuclease P protein subunit RPR2